MTEYRKHRTENRRIKFYSLFTVHYLLFTNKGFALVAALVVMTLLLALGGAAMTMSQLGFTAISAEKKYQLANWAAEYGLYKGVEGVVRTAICPAYTTGDIDTSSSYRYSFFGIKDEDDSNCFIHATGTYGSARVNKNIIVPRSGSDWGALVTRGCTIDLSGSSGIAGCDDDENAYSNRCGVVAALIHESANIKSNSSPETLSLCKAEGTLKGLDGNPPEYGPEQGSLPTFKEELVKKYFNVTDEDSSDTAWDELLEKIETHYSSTYRKVEFYDQTKSTKRFGLPVDSNGKGLAPKAPNPGSTCDPSFPGGTPRCCMTISAKEIKCYSDNNCSSGELIPAGQTSAAIDLEACKQTQTASNADNYPYIAINDNTVSYLKVNPSNTSTKINTDTKFIIEHSGLSIALTDNYGSADDYVKINKDVKGIRIYTGGSVTISGTLSATDKDPGSIIYAGGDVRINANVGNHGEDACPSSFNSSTHIISGGTVYINSPIIKNTNIFANKINITGKPDIYGGYAKVLYALTELKIDTKGAPCIGFPCGNNNNDNPLLILVGDGNPATDGSSFYADGAGGSTISAMIFTDSNNINLKGNFHIQGTLINISTNCTINTTGNALVQFNKKVLDGVYKQLCGTIMQPVRCGGGNKKDWISNTKMTLY